VSAVRDDIEQRLIELDFLADAPFKWVGLVIRYGLRNETRPQYERINKTHGDLPIAIELDARELKEMSAEVLSKTFTVATLEALLDVARQFDCPAQPLRACLEELRGEETPRHVM
jgi:hypothetical protein